jgi:PAS domain-containing protein
MENPRLEASFVIPCNDLMVTLNYQGEIITFNPAFENTTGVKILPPIPFFFKDVVAPSFAKQIPLILSQIINSPLTVFSFEIQLPTPSGQVQTFHWKSFTDPSRKQIFLMGSLLKHTENPAEPEVLVSKVNKFNKFYPQSPSNDSSTLANLTPSPTRDTYRESEKIEALITLENQTILSWNAAAAALFELPSSIQDKSAPCSLSQLFPDMQLNGLFSAELYGQLLEKAAENGVLSFPWLFQTATGKVFPAKAVLIALTGFERPRYQLLVMPSAQQTNQSLELKKAEVQAREEELRQNAE